MAVWCNTGDIGQGYNKRGFVGKFLYSSDAVVHYIIICMFNEYNTYSVWIFRLIFEQPLVKTSRMFLCQI